jgi:hypothetical protein
MLTQISPCHPDLAGAIQYIDSRWIARDRKA